MNETKIDLSARVSALLGLAQSAGAALQAQFGPGQPLEAAWGDEPPRLFEYASGVNLVTVPRAGYGVLPFPVLRALGRSSKEIRLNIELIKRTVRGLEWEIVGRDDAQVDGYQRETKSLTAFFERPDGVNDFDAWVNMLLEDLLALDAVTIYPDMDESGRVMSLDLVEIRQFVAYSASYTGGVRVSSMQAQFTVQNENNFFQLSRDDIVTTRATGSVEALPRFTC